MIRSWHYYGNDDITNNDNYISSQNTDISKESVIDPVSHHLLVIYVLQEGYKYSYTQVAKCVSRKINIHLPEIWQKKDKTNFFIFLMISGCVYPPLLFKNFLLKKNQNYNIID